MAKRIVTHEELRELLDHCPETVVFTWRVNRGGRARAGTVAGAIDTHGYRQIEVFQRAYLAGRLAWFYVTGSWPVNQVDHADGDQLNDAIINLRETTLRQNMANRKKRAGSKSNFIGVVAHEGMWQATVCKDYKRKYLGTFQTEVEAAIAYNAAAKELFGQFARLNNTGVL